MSQKDLIEKSMDFIDERHEMSKTSLYEGKIVSVPVSSLNSKNAFHEMGKNISRVVNLKYNPSDSIELSESIGEYVCCLEDSNGNKYMTESILKNSGNTSRRQFKLHAIEENLSDRDQNIETLRIMHKDRYGVNPRIQFSKLSDKEIQKMIDDMEKNQPLNEQRKLNTSMVRKFIRNVLRAGYSIAVLIGGEVVLKAKKNPNEKEIMDHVTSADMAYIHVRDLNIPIPKGAGASASRNKRAVGTALIVWDVDPGEEIADYTTNIEHLIPKS